MAAQTQHPMKEQLLDSPDSAERSFRRSSRGSIKTRLALGLSACALLATGLLLCAQFYSDPLLLEVSQASEDVDTALKTTLWDRAVAWTGTDQTAEELLPDINKYQSWVLVTASKSRPKRRVGSEPFLSVGKGVTLPVDTINTAAYALEGVLGRRLYPMRIEVVDIAAHCNVFTGPVRPYAIWEAGSGRVFVDRSLAQDIWTDDKAQYMIGAITPRLWGAIDEALKATVQVQTAVWSQSQLAALLAPAASFAVAAAFAAAPPLWFCIVCPAVLGLAAPLIINVALNQAAGYICVHMQLPDDQCFDLLIGALGVGFVLSLASAIPIFYVCRLQDCAQRNSGSWGPTVVGGPRGWRGAVQALASRVWGGGTAGGRGDRRLLASSL